ncbi:MAG: HAD family hydrolase [Clostridia bacterium]|nr:HAD family hydrolase [Clostridia bacterium]
MRKYDYILFDLDGTLTDSYEGITRSVQHALRYWGIEREQEQLRYFIGPPLTDAFRREFAVSEEQAVEMVSRYREYYAVRGIFENRVYDGIPELLANLKKAGCKLILATSKPEVFAKKILDKFELAGYFDHLAGCELDGRRMKKDEVIRWAQENYPFDPARAVMIGDREHDVLGAAKCGLPCIGVLWGYGSREELSENGAIAIAEDVQSLERLLID